MIDFICGMLFAISVLACIASNHTMGKYAMLADSRKADIAGALMCLFAGIAWLCIWAAWQY